MYVGVPQTPHPPHPPHGAQIYSLGGGGWGQGVRLNAPCELSAVGRTLHSHLLYPSVPLPLPHTHHPSHTHPGTLSGWFCCSPPHTPLPMCAHTHTHIHPSVVWCLVGHLCFRIHIDNQNIVLILCTQWKSWRTYCAVQFHFTLHFAWATMATLVSWNKMGARWKLPVDGQLALASVSAYFAMGLGAFPQLLCC